MNLLHITCRIHTEFDANHAVYVWSVFLTLMQNVFRFCALGNSLMAPPLPAGAQLQIAGPGRCYR